MDCLRTIHASDLTEVRHYGYTANDSLIVLIKRICSPDATRRFSSSGCIKMTQADYPQHQIISGLETSREDDLIFDYLKKPTKSTETVISGISVIDDWFAKYLLGPRGSNPDLPFAALVSHEKLYIEWITLVRTLNLVLSHIPKAKVKKAHDLILKLYPNDRRRDMFSVTIKISDIQDLKGVLRSLVSLLSSRTNILEWPEATKYPDLFQELARERRSQESEKTTSTTRPSSRRNSKKRRRLSDGLVAERSLGKWKNRLRSTQ